MMNGNKRTGRAVPAALPLFLLLSFALPLYAQEKAPDGRTRREAVAELRERFRAWAQREVIPKLTEWKGMLDAAMSPEDLAILNDLRSRAALLRQTARENAAALRKAWRAEDYDGVKRHRAQLTEARKELLDILDLATPLAVEYRETLESIGKEAKPQAERWKEEGKRIREEWEEEYGEEIADGSRRFPGRRHLLGGVLNPEVQPSVRAVLFMLWDGRGNIVDDGDDARPVHDEPSLQ